MYQTWWHSYIYSYRHDWYNYISTPLHGRQERKAYNQCILTEMLKYRLSYLNDAAKQFYQIYLALAGDSQWKKIVEHNCWIQW